VGCHRSVGTNTRFIAFIVKNAQAFSRQAAWVTETLLGKNLLLNFDTLRKIRLARTNAKARLVIRT
jgi:hypothetical protein